MPKPVQILTTEECAALLKAVDDYHRGYMPSIIQPRNHLMILLMLDAGLRVGELIQLKVDDLWFGDHWCNNLILRAEITKTKHERMVPLTQRTLDAILECHNELPWWRAEASPQWAFTTNYSHSHITARQVQNIVGELSSKAFGRRINPHVLRHTYATRLMQKTNIRVVQQLLGHASLGSTQIYTHPNLQDLKDAVSHI